jgi:ABC-2 type transport system permease protein
MLAQAAGTLAVRLPVMATTACVCAFLFTGTAPALRTLLLFAPFAVTATLVTSALYVGVGLLAFWLTDVSPVYWLFQKALFVLGGMMLPLELYPRWLQRVAEFTPFSALLWGPAQLVLRAMAPHEVWLLAARLGAWALVVAALLFLIFRRASRSLQVSGG